MTKIKIILGSTRPGRFSEHAGVWIAEIAKQRPGLEIEVLDLRDYPMPFFNDPIPPLYVTGDYLNPEVNKWANKIKEADGFILVTPEYNRGTSAILKNALDSIYKEWNDKPVAFVAYGVVGGARAIEQLHSAVLQMQMHPIGNAVYIMSPWNLVEEGNKLKSDILNPYIESGNKMLDSLLKASL